MIPQCFWRPRLESHSESHTSARDSSRKCQKGTKPRRKTEREKNHGFIYCVSMQGGPRTPCPKHRCTGGYVLGASESISKQTTNLLQLR